MGNDGVAYELFVQKVQQALFDAQQIGGYRTVNVQHNIKLVGKDGEPRQFDLYWEFELGGHVYRTIVECKDYANDVPVDKVDALAGKLKEFPELKGIIATRNGFQSGAIKKAQANGIDVIVVRDEDPKKDWISQDGTPLIRTIVVNLNCIVPAAVLSVDFDFDKAWAKEHDVSEVTYGALATDIFVDDHRAGVIRSIQSIVDEDNSAYGYQDRDVHTASASGLEDAYLVLPTGLTVKLLGYKFMYRPGYVLKDEIRVEPEVLGVVEFIADKKKKMLLKQGRKTIVRTCE